MFERDAAYHNGTVWPWLLGPYAEAVARTGAFSPSAVHEARSALAPLIRKLDAECAGSGPPRRGDDDGTGGVGEQHRTRALSRVDPAR